MEESLQAGTPAEEEQPASTEETAALAEAESSETLDDQALNEMIEELCNSKAEEFRMLGYESVTGKDVWECVSSGYKELPPLHKIVNDILSLRVTAFMNWMTLSIWKQSEKEPRI